MEEINSIQLYTFILSLFALKQNSETNFSPLVCRQSKDSITLDPILKAKTFEKSIDMDCYDFVCPSVKSLKLNKMSFCKETVITKICQRIC